MQHSTQQEHSHSFQVHMKHLPRLVMFLGIKQVSIIYTNATYENYTRNHYQKDNTLPKTL